jgi:integral membrane protein
MIRLLRKVAFWEATFFVVLCVAWVVTLTGYKFTGAWQTALVVVGFTHGCVFTLYLFLVLLVRARMRWSLLTTGSILVAGLIPGGGYVVEAWALSGARVAALADVL